MSFIDFTIFIAGLGAMVEELESLDVEGDVLIELFEEFEVLGLLESIMLGNWLVELLDSDPLEGVLVLLQELNTSRPKAINKCCFFI